MLGGEPTGHLEEARGEMLGAGASLVRLDEALQIIIGAEPSFAGVESETWLTRYPRSQDPAPHKSVRI